MSHHHHQHHHKKKSQNPYWKIGLFLCLGAVALFVFGDRANREQTLPLVIFCSLIGAALIALSLISAKS